MKSTVFADFEGYDGRLEHRRGFTGETPASKLWQGIVPWPTYKVLDRC